MKKALSIILSPVMIFAALPLAAVESSATGAASTGDYYELITSASQMVDGARYLIASAWESYVLDGSLGEDMDSANNHIEVDFDGDRIAATESNGTVHVLDTYTYSSDQQKEK